MNRRTLNIESFCAHPLPKSPLLFNAPPKPYLFHYCHSFSASGTSKGRPSKKPRGRTKPVDLVTTLPKRDSFPPCTSFPSLCNDNLMVSLMGSSLKNRFFHGQCSECTKIANRNRSDLAIFLHSGQIARTFPRKSPIFARNRWRCKFDPSSRNASLIQSVPGHRRDFRLAMEIRNHNCFACVDERTAASHVCVVGFTLVCS